MSLILVVEPKDRDLARIESALAVEGWEVRVVSGRGEAMTAVAGALPDLVVIDGDAEGSADLLSSFARRGGGPGAVAIVTDAAEAGERADAVIEKPIDEQALREAVESCLALGGRAGSPPAPVADALTSADIFGDMLAEVEEEVSGARPSSASLDRQLEETLSGVLDPSKPKPRAKRTVRRPRTGSEEVDDLLSQTLSGLAMDRPKRAKKTKSPAEAEPVADMALELGLGDEPESAEPVKVEPVLEVVATEPSPREAPAVELEAEKESDAPAEPLAPPAPPPAPPEPEAELFATQRIELPRPAPEVAKPALGEFGQYTLLERIAVGGMAELWKARMKGVEGFQKTVAIKKILPHLTDSVDFVTMFIDEAKLAAQLDHQNIIHIYNLGKIEDDYFIAMEYVDGNDLRSILNAARRRNVTFPLGLSVLVASRLASALDYAHRKRDFEGRELGLVHRDVSPQNVLISNEGEVKLCDFGIVKAVAKASKTQMGALKGKLQYMSPEQAWGRTVDSRSDIFSLGAVLFETLTGRRLFAGESEISVLEAVRECRTTSPRELVADLPEEVEAIVLRALQRDPDDRYQTAGEMQKELESVLYSLKPTPGQDDLAAFMQRLYRDQAVAGGALRSPSEVLEPTPYPAGSGADAGSSPERDAAVVLPAKADPEGGERSGRVGLYLAIAAAVLLALATVVWQVTRSGSGGESGGTTAPAVEAQPVPPPVTPSAGPDETSVPGAEGEEPSTEDPAALMEEEVRQTTEDLQESLAEEYAASIKVLEDRVAEIQAETEDAEPEAEPETAEEPAVEPEEAAVPETAEPTTPSPTETPSEGPPEVEDLATNELGPPEDEAAELEPGPAEPVAVETPPPAPSPAPAQATEPPPPAVREGDLVDMGPGVTKPSFVSFTEQPEYPIMARRMRREGVVLVRVLVNERGTVDEVQVLKADPLFEEAAIEAARAARWQPATKDGVRVKMWMELNIPFRL